MEQHFAVEDEFHDIRIYAFRDGATRPNKAKPGDEIQLELVSTGEQRNANAELEDRKSVV